MPCHTASEVIGAGAGAIAADLEAGAVVALEQRQQEKSHGVRIQVSRDVADAQPALGIGGGGEGKGGWPRALQPLAEGAVALEQRLGGHGVAEVEQEQLKRRNLELAWVALEGGGAELEDLVYASLPVEQVAEHPVGEDEPGVEGEHAAQRRLGLGIALQAHQRPAIVVDGVGPVGLVAQDGLELRRSGREIALRLQDMEQRSAGDEILRPLQQRGLELCGRGRELALRLQHIGEHDARFGELGSVAQRLLEQLPRPRQLAVRIKQLAEVVAGEGVGGVERERALVAGEGAGGVAERLEADTEVEMPLGVARRGGHGPAIKLARLWQRARAL